MEPEVSLSRSQEPSTGPYPEPDNITPSYFFKILLNIILQTPLSSSYSLFPSGFPTKTLYKFLFSPCVLHGHTILLDFFILIMWRISEGMSNVVLSNHSNNLCFAKDQTNICCTVFLAIYSNFGRTELYRFPYRFSFSSTFRFVVTSVFSIMNTIYNKTLNILQRPCCLAF
jgi:hypothetical protein